MVFPTSQAPPLALRLLGFLSALMGMTNLRIMLERKFADWLGEQQDLQKHIDEVTAAYEALDKKRERLERVFVLLDSMKTIMSEIAPTWKPESIRPSRKNQIKIPFDTGEATRLAFDIMRREDRPLRTREIAKLLVEEQGLDPEDRDLLNRLKVAIDASLRAKKGKLADYTGEKFHRKWFVIKRGGPKEPTQ